MAVDTAQQRSELTISAEPTPDTDRQVLALHGEALAISRRRVDTSVVRAIRTTRTREQLVDEELHHERVEVEHVPVGRVVESVPPVREEGDTTILSVVVEEVVVQRRLVLKEEVRIRRVKTTERHRETVILREQEATVTRTPLEAAPAAKASVPDQATPHQPIDKDTTS